MTLGATLAWHFGALGDFVLSWPALGLLAAEGELHLAGHPGWGRLILPPERAHDRESRRLAPLFLAEPIADDLTAWLRGFSRAVVFHHHPDPALLGHLRLAGIREVWRLPTRPPAGQGLHAGDNQVLHLRGRGLRGAAQAPACRVARPERQGQPVLAPGSGGRGKRLEPELAARLAAIMARGGARPLLLLGPAEDPAYRARLRAAMSRVGHESLADPSPEELAALLQSATVYVGADSGVSHLAAALGAPCLAVFQASDPAVWSPRGRRVEVCRPDQAQERLEGMLATMG